ncbi:MAG: hypothetical protein JKY80_00425 [Mariprofundaceae bacterium]|nr:hypothetical protein [Mariprofundaceae bacterium]
MLLFDAKVKAEKAPEGKKQGKFTDVCLLLKSAASVGSWIIVLPINVRHRAT